VLYPIQINYGYSANRLIMLLTKNDIENGFTAAVSAGRIPDFVQHLDEGGGLIYGIGGAISEYWTAYELYGQKSARS
jgi:hypothetical protein